MATTLNTTVKVLLNATQAKALDLDTVQDALSIGTPRTLTNGVGANMANSSFHDRRTLAQSAVEDLDVSGTALQDAFGDDIALARIKLLYVKNNGTASTLKVGGDANSVPLFGAAADYVIIPPGGELLLVCSTAAGWVVTGGTGDIIQVEHGGEDAADLTYDIVIIGGKT